MPSPYLIAVQNGGFLEAHRRIAIRVANCVLFFHRSVVKTRRQFCSGFFRHSQSEGLWNDD